MAQKVFDWDGRKGTLIDSVSGNVLVKDSTSFFANKDKGACLVFDGVNDGLSMYGTINIPNGTYSVEIAYRLTGNTNTFKLIDFRYSNSTGGGVGTGVGKIEDNGANLLTLSSGTPYINNVDKTAGYYYERRVDRHLVVSGIVINSGRICFGCDYEGTGNAKINFYYIKIYSGTLTEQERASLYRDFLNSYPQQKEKRPNYINKPMDLSREVNNTLGSELIDQSQWYTIPYWNFSQSCWSQSGTTLVSNGGSGYLEKNNLFTVGKKYHITITVSRTSGTLYVDDSVTNALSITSSGTFTTYFIATGTMPGLYSATFVGLVIAFYIKEVTGLVAAYNFIPQGNTLVDISGRNNNLTISGKVISTPSGLNFNKLTGKAVSSSVILNNSTTWGVKIRFNKFTYGPDWWSGFLGGTSTKHIGVDVSGNKLTFRDNASNAIDMGVVPIGIPFDLCFYSAGTTIITYLNGVYLSTITPATTQIYVDRFMKAFGTDSYGAGGELVDCRIYDRIFTLQEIKDYHNQFVQPTLVCDFSDEGTDGVSKVPSGWTKQSGAFKVGEVAKGVETLPTLKNSSKYLECVTAGTIAIPSKQAYGTWEFDWYKGGDSNLGGLYFINSNKKLYPNAQGYVLYLENNEGLYLYYMNGASASVKCSTAVSYITNNTWYRFKVTRSTSGVFTIYIKGGSFGILDWTQITVAGGTNPVTENTIITSEDIIVYQTAGDRIANILLNDGIKQ